MLSAVGKEGEFGRGLHAKCAGVFLSYSRAKNYL